MYVCMYACIMYVCTYVMYVSTCVSLCLTMDTVVDNLKTLHITTQACMYVQALLKPGLNPEAYALQIWYLVCTAWLDKWKAFAALA